MIYRVLEEVSTTDEVKYVWVTAYLDYERAEVIKLTASEVKDG